MIERIIKLVTAKHFLLIFNTHLWKFHLRAINIDFGTKIWYNNRSSIYKFTICIYYCDKQLCENPLLFMQKQKRKIQIKQKTLWGIQMGLFDKLKEPIFLKETSSAKEQLAQLKLFLANVPNDVKSKVEQDIKLLEAGIYGEDNIIYELKNSHLPMYIIHDLYLEDNGLTAQIDFLIITRKRHFIIECKNLIGNIEINTAGDFIRTMQYNGKYKKEGIYSPITQNKRHLELLRQLRAKSKTNFLTKALYENNFYNMYRPIVVLANPKTILNVKYAKKEIKEQVIKADQLIEYIKTSNTQWDSEPRSDKKMLELAEFFLDLHTENKVDYLEKYRNLELEEKEEIIEQIPIKESFIEIAQTEKIAIPIQMDSDVYKELKAYRLQKCREESIKPYLIFNDKQMEELISKNPKTIDDLMKVSGFGEVKCKKYGEDIISIILK